MAASAETQAWSRFSRSHVMGIPVSMGGTSLMAKALASSLELSTYVIKKHQVSLPLHLVQPPHEESRHLHVPGWDVGSETQRAFWDSPQYVGRARKNMKKKKEYHLHMGKAANQDNRLRGTDEVGSHHHNSKPNNSERRNFLFFFTCHSSWYCHSPCSCW